jgi:hypothetical protein
MLKVRLNGSNPLFDNIEAAIIDVALYRNA